MRGPGDERLALDGPFYRRREGGALRGNHPEHEMKLFISRPCQEILEAEYWLMCRALITLCQVYPVTTRLLNIVTSQSPDLAQDVCLLSV